jgi:hypothetical protein
MKLFFRLCAIVALFYNCNGSEKHGEKTDMQNLLSTSLYDVIVNYQKLYPINPKAEAIPLYYISFNKQGTDDTIVTVSLSQSGLHLTDSEKVIAVYSDSMLKPTIIRESNELLSKDFIVPKKPDSFLLKKYLPRSDVDYPESFPPIYKYKVNGKQLIHISIDTVWSKW